MAWLANFLKRLFFRIFNCISVLLVVGMVLLSLIFLVRLNSRDLDNPWLVWLLTMCNMTFFAWFFNVIARQLWDSINDGKKKPEWISELLRQAVAGIPVVHSTNPPANAHKSNVAEITAQNSDAKRNSESYHRAEFEGARNKLAKKIQAQNPGYNGSSANEYNGEEQLDSMQLDVEILEMTMALDEAADRLEPSEDKLKTAEGRRQLYEMAGEVFWFLRGCECVEEQDRFYNFVFDKFDNINKKYWLDYINRADRWKVLGAYKAIRYYVLQTEGGIRNLFNNVENELRQDLLYRMMDIDEQMKKGN